MLWTLCEILCKVIRAEGVWEQRQTQKHDLLMLERSYFQYFGARKEKVYDVSGFISQDLRLYSEIQADTNLEKTQIQSKVEWLIRLLITRAVCYSTLDG